MNRRAQFRSVGLDIAAMFALLFGLVTIRSGGAVVLGDAASVAAAGAFVGFVVWFNFLAGFAYVAAAIGLWFRAPWAAWFAVALALATLIAFAGFGVHVASGNPYEMRTVWAMLLRSAVWIVIAGLACWTLDCLRRSELSPPR